jgi:hypothetical protein
MEGFRVGAEWRMEGNCPPPIFPLHHVLDLSGHDICSSVHKGLLYAQRIELRLSDINDIPFADLTTLLHTALQGFALLAHRFGPFVPTEDMLFLGREGQVRLWLHPSLAQTHPQTDRRITEYAMVEAVVEMMQRNADVQESDPVHFQQFLAEKRLLGGVGFTQGLGLFTQYCLENGLQVGSRMQSICELYQQETSFQDVIVTHPILPTHSNTLPTQLSHNGRLKTTPDRQ